MLLSIVECSHYKKTGNWKGQNVPVQKINDCCEVVGPVEGPSAAVMRNRGLQASFGKWIFFKDSDCEINVPSLIEMVKNYENQGLKTVVGGSYKNSSTGYFAMTYHYIQRKWVLGGVLKPGKRATHLLGGALLVPRKVFEQVGLFDEEIGWGAEETAWVAKARAQGIETRQSYRLQVNHENSLSFLGFLKRAWFQSFNSAYYQVEKRKPSDLKKYFKGKLQHWPALLLFFGVASIGRGAGAVLKWGGF